MYKARSHTHLNDPRTFIHFFFLSGAIKKNYIKKKKKKKKAHNDVKYVKKLLYFPVKIVILSVSLWQDKIGNGNIIL